MKSSIEMKAIDESGSRQRETAANGDESTVIEPTENLRNENNSDFPYISLQMGLRLTLKRVLKINRSYTVFTVSSDGDNHEYRPVNIFSWPR